MTVGEKIRTRRIELGMTMDDLGKAIGVQRSAINKYEKGIITDLKRSTISALAKALNVSSVYLLDDEPETDELTQTERSLVYAYRYADDGTKSAVRKLLDLPNEQKNTVESAI